MLVNLASQEYFKAVDQQALKARVVNCVFEDFKDGQYKIISFYAKRARPDGAFCGDAPADVAAPARSL